MKNLLVPDTFSEVEIPFFYRSEVIFASYGLFLSKRGAFPRLHPRRYNYEKAFDRDGIRIFKREGFYVRNRAGSRIFHQKTQIREKDMNDFASVLKSVSASASAYSPASASQFPKLMLTLFTSLSGRNDSLPIALAAESAAFSPKESH